VKKFIIRQTIDLDLQWVIEAEDVQDALEKAWGNFDSSKVIDIQPLDWDHPWDAEEMSGDVTYFTDEELQQWKDLGIL
jgi:hypothetical protein